MIRTSTLEKWRSSFREQLVELAQACLLLAASTPGSIALQLSTLILTMLMTIVMLRTIDDVDDFCDVVMLMMAILIIVQNCSLSVRSQAYL